MDGCCRSVPDSCSSSAALIGHGLLQSKAPRMLLKRVALLPPAPDDGTFAYLLVLRPRTPRHGFGTDTSSITLMHSPRSSAAGRPPPTPPPMPPFPLHLTSSPPHAYPRPLSASSCSLSPLSRPTSLAVIGPPNPSFRCGGVACACNPSHASVTH